MNRDNKRKIKGISNTEKDYKGQIVTKIKKVIAVTLAAGITVTALQAVNLYNNWNKTGNLDDLPKIVKQLSNKGIQEKTNEEKIKELVSIIEEYRDVTEKNDIERKDELDKKIKDGNYIDIVYQETKNSIIEKLGYDIEKVDIIQGRDGFFLVDKEQLNKGIGYAPNGTVVNRVKIKDKKGNAISISGEMKEILEQTGIELSLPSLKNVITAEKAYNRLISIKEMKNVIDNNEEIER